MARDYKNAQKRSANADRPPGSWTSFFTGLGFGLVVAVIVYYWGEHTKLRAAPAPHKNESATTVESPSPSVPEVPSGDQKAAADAPGPKFDFYKILPEVEVKVPESTSATAPKADGTPSATARSTIGAYMLQVGSFHRYEEADQAKAQLALQGVHASIQRIVINGQEPWYRVHIGPYAALPAAQAMRGRLSQLGMNAIVLHLGGNEP